MHFWIPEVAQLIFEYVYDPDRTEEDIKGRITVAALARTCQAFRDPALDVLWAQLHSLDPLVLCSGGRRDFNSQVVSHLDFLFSQYISDHALRSGSVHCTMRTGAFSRVMRNVFTH
jgi:hypothetical protein